MNPILTGATKRFALCSCLVYTLIAVAPVAANDDNLSGQIAKLQREFKELTQQFSTSEKGNSDEESIRSLVKRTFDLELQIQEMRIAQAESDLKKVKQQFAERKRARDTIIDQRVTELTKNLKSVGSERDNVPASVLATEGWQLWRKRDLRAALVKFEASVAKDPKDDHALNGLGWSYLQTGQYEKAVDAFQRGRKINENNGGILNGLGQAFQALGRTKDARDLLVESVERINKQVGEAVAIKRGLVAPWMVLVRLDIDTKNYDGAIEWAKRYLEHKKDDEVMVDLLEQARAGKAEAEKAE
jgi:tetratricopeptide (TPR) repeat protein